MVESKAKHSSNPDGELAIGASPPESTPQTLESLADIYQEVPDPQDLVASLEVEREQLLNIARRVRNNRNLREGSQTEGVNSADEGHVSDSQVAADLPRLRELVLSADLTRRVTAYGRAHLSGRVFDIHLQMKKILALIENDLLKLEVLDQKAKVVPEGSRLNRLLDYLQDVFTALKK